MYIFNIYYLFVIYKLTCFVHLFYVYLLCVHLCVCPLNSFSKGIVLRVIPERFLKDASILLRSSNVLDCLDQMFSQDFEIFLNITFSFKIASGLKSSEVSSKPGWSETCIEEIVFSPEKIKLAQ